MHSGLGCKSKRKFWSLGGFRARSTRPPSVTGICAEDHKFLRRTPRRPSETKRPFRSAPLDSATPTLDARKTSILVRFTPAPDVTTAQYDETISRLEKSGDWLPEGLAYHVAFKSGDQLRVSEIWDSREQFDAFGERLMPDACCVTRTIVW